MLTITMEKITQIPLTKWLTFGFLALGVLLILIFGVRSFRSFKQMRYVRAEGLDRGDASVDAIRGWMTLDYVAVAYAVPEEYLLNYLGIPFEQRNGHETLRDLNRIYDLGLSADRQDQRVIEAVAEAIEAYRANPVVTGLDDIRPWMTIRYISVSTGVSETYIFEQIGIPAENDNEFKDLGRLDKEYRYEGGLRALIDTLRNALANYEKAP
ncbi:MAG: hypothetical protein KC423_06985 [Anaerolineales bacterium]|nr:hypothetical protein [Anaerolineales bacterium]